MMWLFYWHQKGDEMTTPIKGKFCKVCLGTFQIAGLGSWEMTGVTTDLLESTEFGDDWKQFEMGLKDGGEITFSGLYDRTDSTGQEDVIDANLNDTQVTDFRCYVDTTSYWVPATTSPTSYVLITQWRISADKSGLVQFSGTAKISGKMHIV
jgi:hypothetical protein